MYLYIYITISVNCIKSIKSRIFIVMMHIVHLTSINDVFFSNFIGRLTLLFCQSYMSDCVIYWLKIQIHICSSSTKVLGDSTLSPLESPDKDWRILQICNTVLALWALINISSRGISSIPHFDGFICLFDEEKLQMPMLHLHVQGRFVCFSVLSQSSKPTNALIICQGTMLWPLTWFMINNNKWVLDVYIYRACSVH